MADEQMVGQTCSGMDRRTDGKQMGRWTDGTIGGWITEGWVDVG